MTLKDLKIGGTGIVKTVGGDGDLRRHFLDMGLIPGAAVQLVKYAPMGDPIEFRLHDYELTLRKDDASYIEIEVEDSINVPGEKQEKVFTLIEHPGFGEGGRYHDKETETPLPEGTILQFALAGNQNCGKTTLFNQLTGSNQHVGNFPGVTVDRKSGPIRGYENTQITDLPGIYSLSPYTAEEIVTQQYILDEKPQGIINIVDATNIERSLYLTLQLMELEVPIVLALNMMDELTGNGGAININAMEELLGIPVVPIAAAKNSGVDELIAHALHVAKYQEKPGRMDFCKADEAGGAVHRCIHGIIHLVEDHAKSAGIPVRFAATKLVEGDRSIEDALHLEQNEKEMIEHIIVQMEEERGLDRVAAIADMRYAFITNLCGKAVKHPHESKERIRSEKLDKLLTGKYTAMPCFIMIMALVFFISFGSLGAWLESLLGRGIEALTAMADSALTSWNINPVLHSLVIDGALKGIGSVLSFVPIIVVLFFFLSIMEDSGYMARVAFFTDHLLRRIGLSGRSIVPMVIGFGCSVPSIMATRTLPSERDRKMTMLLTPFMSCTAKLPVYGFFTSILFPKYKVLIIAGLYVFGILAGILVSIVAKRTIYKGEAVPFVMELPNYRMPGSRNVGLLLWDKTKDFLQKAFTIIFVSSVVIWFLSNFDFRLNFIGMMSGQAMQSAAGAAVASAAAGTAGAAANTAVASAASTSILASIAGFIAPIFKPLGFGDWRFVTALIAGFIAKESVVSTLTVLMGTAGTLTSGAALTASANASVQAAIAGMLSTRSALALLVFCLLYTPCVAAIAAIKREMGIRHAVGIVIFQCAIAYIFAYIVYLI